jgi:DNA-binding IclR family transcriptional regulator
MAESDPIPPERAADAGARRIQSLDRAIALLKHIALSRDPVSITELVRATRLNRSTIWRLVMTLEYHGLVDRRSDGGYTAGSELFRMAGAAPTLELLKSRAVPVLHALSQETGETASLVVPTSTGIVALAQSEAPGFASVNSIGVRLPLHATASGKLRLAFAAPDELPRLLAASTEAFTERTITDAGALGEELDRVRVAGVATERDEFESGVSGASAPVFDDRGSPIAFVSIWGLTARASGARLDDLARRVKSAAADIESTFAGGQTS